jgi:hypothetical protein
MSTAVNIILERLKTHPEEFVRLDGDIHQGGTWSPLVNTMHTWATPEEMKEINESMVQARRLLADEVALKILSGEYYELTPKDSLFYHHPHNPVTTGQTYTVANLKEETLDAYHAEMKKEMIAEINKLKIKQALGK